MGFMLSHEAFHRCCSHLYVVCHFAGGENVRGFDPKKSKSMLVKCVWVCLLNIYSTWHALLKDIDAALIPNTVE